MVGRVVIGMDPHKRSATIEVIDAREKVLATGRFGTYRVWAVEDCAGVGRHLAQRLVADGKRCSTCR